MKEIRKLTLADEAAFAAFQAVLLAEKATGNDLVETKKVQDFQAFFEKTRRQEQETDDPNWSTSTNYYYFKDGEMVARIGCRWELKGELARVGGHIGYVTRTDYRGQGIMTELLAFALKKYAQRGVAQVLITARTDNRASCRLIEKFGARPDGQVQDRGYNWQRYWVSTGGEKDDF